VLLRWLQGSLLGFLLVLLFIAPRPAGADTIFTVGLHTYQHDQKSFSMDIAPQVLNGRIMIPVRYLAESCGAAVGWDSSKNTVTLVDGQTTIQLVIGSKQEQVTDRPLQWM